jgi:hypothetical protein
MSRLLSVLLCLCCGLLPLFAQEIAVPIEAQIPLLCKVITYDRDLKKRAGGELVIAVLYQRKFKSSLNIKDEVVGALEKMEILTDTNLRLRCVAIELIDEKNLLQELVSKEVDVVYLTPTRAFDIDSITLVTRERHVLSLTGVPDYVGAGISVGVAAKGEKPQILINRVAAQEEGADFSSQLLKLAKVIN